MPTTRRSSGTAAAAASGKQSTLSFNHRVTKASAPPKQPGKSALVTAASATAPTKQSPLAKHVASVVDDESVPEEEEEEVVGGDEDAKVEVAEISTAEAETEPLKDKEVPAPSEAEVKALKMTDRQIETYWRGVEAERIAKRVHQEDLGTPEKVLRYFDVSSQYGPCIGITRLKRWQRAERLGLKPPVEVLAVLLKEEKKIKSKSGGASSKSGSTSVSAATTARDSTRLQTAHMDEILNSTAIGAS
ncbi:DNA polymerase delta, subunit 4-domain-containing protein [Microdochium trichocladiopsis]|uniref:DNA polymerase delta, subunit 4-domain-containing protein n=1 Tax=Microdochium trichocladiopsis TaxID=1682393 RepID=A0A9P8YIK5_9PEZI|nr:DNA polymerase delta, subunit 4-domain-containing protein [Microdochium trichocladiopsis]KAH7039976.1 DNA polymerase delta, subunit 4-domain-containing protein [Microdochium trichocladiopsis]